MRPLPCGQCPGLIAYIRQHSSPAWSQLSPITTALTLTSACSFKYHLATLLKHHHPHIQHSLHLRLSIIAPQQAHYCRYPSSSYIFDRSVPPNQPPTNHINQPPPICATLSPPPSPSRPLSLHLPSPRVSLRTSSPTHLLPLAALPATMATSRSR